MTLEQLQELAGQGGVVELNVLSHEGSIYLVEAVTDDGSQMLKKQLGDSRPWTFRSFEQARRALFDVPLETIDLVHNNIYDEIDPGFNAGNRAPAMRLTYPLRP